MFISELLSSARVIHDFESMNRLPHYIESADQENDDELNESSLIHSLCNVLFYTSVKVGRILIISERVQTSRPSICTIEYYWTNLLIDRSKLPLFA